MSIQNRTSRRLATALAAGCAGLTIAGAAGAVDLRDWGRKFSTDQRFVVLAQFNNQAVLDKETQLVWHRTPTGDAVSWFTALQACQARDTGGRKGWRLPSFHELSSLADSSAAPGELALPAGHPFLSVPVGGYWSATRTAPQPDGSFYGYYVKMHVAGGVVAAPVTHAHYYWCVRGGGPISEY